MIPGKLNLVCPQGATFSKVFQLFDKDGIALDLTGYTADMQARETYTSEDYLFNIIDGAGITISGNDVSVVIAWDTTEQFAPGKYVWDIEITAPDGKRDRLLEGSFTVTPGITR
jgi:hypothetical protein